MIGAGVLGAGPVSTAAATPAMPPAGVSTDAVKAPSSNEVAHDVSAPLRDLVAKAPSPAPGASSGGPSAVKPVPDRRQPAAPVPARPKPKTPLPPMPATDVNVSGQPNINGYYPPDTNGDVGPRNYVQMVNVTLAIYNKAGDPELGPFNSNVLWGGFGGPCAVTNDGDGIVQYDQLADRWVISQFSVSAGANLECVAVSVTGDPTGAYYRYAFDYGDEFPDYPKMSVWPDGYYVTYNIFGGADENTFLGARTCALQRSSMLQGAVAVQQCFLLSDTASLLPADLDGSTLPPAGAPNYQLALSPTDNAKLVMYRFAVNWDNPASSTLTGPTEIAVDPFTAACTAVDGRCVPQPGTAQLLDSLGDRLMYRLAYRNFGDHESLVVNHTVAMDGNPALTGQTGVRWYEIRSPGTTPVVYQQGTQASPSAGEFRWMASIAQDSQGNMGLGYSSSSDALFPSINYLGRLAGDPLGTMNYEPGTIQTGSGSQLGPAGRWGDYTSMSVDPTDDCTFWYTNQYLDQTSAVDWVTRVASFRFPGCTGAATVPGAPQAATATPGVTAALISWSPPASNGGMQVAGYKVTAQPGGATCSTEVGVDPDPLRCTVSGLTGGTAYTFSITARNGIGVGAAATAGPVTPGASFVPLTPVRIADTRPGPVPFPTDKVPMAAGSTLAIPVGGQFGVPANAGAVALNVTAVRPSGSGHLTVFPCGATKPLASTLNYDRGAVVPNLAVAQLGTGGQVCVFTTASTDLAVDLNGWLPDPPGFTSMTPIRVADTRADSGVPFPVNKAPIPAGGTLAVPIAGQFGVPGDAAAVSVNVTVVGPASPGHLTAFPCGQGQPLASNVNFGTGGRVANAVIGRLGAEGTLCLASSSRADVVVDLNGWFAGAPGFSPMNPVRIADTRDAQPVAVPWPKAPLQANRPLRIPVTGQFGVPDSAGSVSLNVTVIGPTGSGHVTVYPCSQAPPVVSNLNFVNGQIVANAAMVGIGDGGDVCVVSSTATNIAVDLNGWFPRTV